MDPLVKKVVDTGISKGVDFDKIASAMYNSGAGENQVLQAQEYYNQVKKKSPSVAGVSPSISGRTPSSSGFGPFKVKGQGDPNDPSGLYGQVEEANRRINTANRIYDVLSKKGELSPKEIESARKDYQEYRSFYPNLPIDPSKDVGLLTDNIARDRMNIKAKSQPDESNYRKWMDYIYQSQPGGENGFLATILRGTEKVAGDIVSLGGAVISFGGLINDETDAFYSSVFGEETAENYKKTFKDTPLEPGAISQAGMGVAQFGKGMAEQWNENTKKIAGNWGMNEEQYEKGPGEALLEGDFSTAGKGIAIGMLHTMPELIATAIRLRTMKGAALAGEAITANLISKGTPKWIAGAAGRARAMAPTTLPLYTGANYAEVLDDPEFTTGEKLLYAVGSAAGSTIAESVGGFGEYFLGGAAKKQAVNQVKSSIMQSIGRGTVDMLKAAGVEGAEEVLDGGIQQALGIAFGDRKFDANSLLDGFLIGAAMGGSTNLISKSPSLIGLSSDMLTTIKITDELSKIQTALSDPSLSDVERDLLTNRARVANNEIRRAKNSAAIFFQGYTPEDLQETMTLNSEIRRQIDSMPSFKTDEAKSAAIQSVKDSVARLKQIESKYDSQKKQQVQGAVQAGAQPGGVPVEGAGTEATAPGGVLQNVGQTQEEQVAQQRTEQASAFNVRPRLKKMKVTAKNAPGAYKMMMDALSNYTDEFLQQNKTDRASVERGIKSLFDVISSLDAKGRTVEIDVMGSIDEANKLFGFEINEVDGKFKVSSKIPGANRVFDTKEGADAYTKRVLYRGVNMMSDGGDVKISVLLPAMLDNTGYHEALHSLEVFDDKSADKLVVSLMNAIKKLPVLDGRMIAFMESYRGKPEPERNSEYLAELGSMISSGEISVEIRDSVIKSLTKSFLDFFKNMIGSDVDVTPTAEQLARTFNDIAEKLGRGEKQPPYRKTRKKGEESGAVDRAKVRFQGFDSWKGDNEYVYGSAVQDVKTGTPIVAKGYHGTTNDFYEFDASVKGNVEGYLGRVNYFTTDYQDAAINYQSEGPDLKSRIEKRADEIEGNLNDDYIDDNDNVDIQSVISDYSLNEDDILKLEDIFNGDLSEVKPSEISYFLSEKELKGDEDRVLEVYIKLNNPLVLGGNPVYYNSYGSDTKEYADMYEMYAEEVADDNGVSIEEAKDEYDYEIRDRIMESPKFGNKILEAFTDALDKNAYGFMSDRYSEPLQDYLYDEEVNLNQLDRDLRSNNIFFENENGELAFSQVLSDFYKNLGFDGIILANPSNTFRGMGISPSTSHIHVFDEYANQIKLADGSNVTFGETRDIRFQRAASDEISMDDFTALSKRLNKFFKGNVKIVDADTFEKESEKFTGEKLDLKSYDGDVYGAVLPNGVMFINGLDVNSLLHEHTHLFNQVVMKVNPRLWSSIKEAVKKTAEWSQVKRNPLYSNLKTDDEVADEVFSKIVGNAAKNGWQKYTNQSIYQNIKALAQKFYNTILDLFGVDYYKGMSASGLADLTLTELMGGVSTTPYQIDAKINELMSKLLKGTKYLNQVRFNIDPNSRKKFEKALGEKDGRALYEIFGNVQDPSKLIDFAKSKFPIKGTLSSVAKRSVKDNNGDVVRNGNFGSIVVYKEYEKFLNKELEQVVDKATLDPQDLLNEVGYTLFNPTNLNDARNSFLHYYKSGHNICTLNPGSIRFSGSFVTFIVRNDADQTPSAEDLTQDNLTDEWRKYLEKKGRKNSDGTYNLNGLMPDALDPYSTSVISLQINKSNGSTKEISRYNHQIGSPDNIFSRDFDNLIEGLSDAMFKKFGVEKNTKQSTTRMPNGVIQDANGAYYNYIYETNGVYYGDGYYLENGVATLLDRGSERMVDGWVISNRGDGTATNIDRTTYGFFYGDVKKVNYIKGDEISLTTENGNFVFEVKNGAVVRLIDFPKKWRLDKLNDFYADFRISLEYDKNGNLILPLIHFIQSSYINMLWADDIIGLSSSFDFNSTKIQYLGNLQYIKGDANFNNSQVKSLGELKYIGGYAGFIESQVKSLGELKYIGGDADFSNSQVQSLGELKYIGSDAFFDSQIQSLGKLKYIGGYAGFIDSQVQSLGELKCIIGDARFNNSQIQSLGELKYIGGYADFDGSQVQSLGELKYIGGNAFFRNSQVQSLGELKYIRGDADFRDSQVQSLGELKYIGSRVIYSNSPIDSKAIEDIKRKSEGSTAEILVRDADEFMTSMNREFEQFGKETEEEATESQPKFQALESEREVITLNDGKKITPTVIDGSTVFYHASSKKRIGRLRPNNAIQWGKAIYFSPSREDVVYEFGDENVTEVRLNLSNPVYTNAPDFSKVANRAVEIYTEEQIKKGAERESYSLDDIEDGYYFGEAAKQLGYDAIIDLNPNNYGGEIAVIDEGAVIYPEDIKSISPPKGKSDSILFQSIGERGAEGIQIEQERNAIEIDSKLMSLDYTLRRPRENTLVFVPINKLLQRHAKDNPSYDVTKKENQIGNRVQKAKEFLINYLSDNSFINPKTRERTRGTKVTYEPSVVGLYGGKLSFEDGRHRVLAAQEMGATAVAVEIPKTQVNTFKEELGVVDKKEWLKAPNGKDTNLTPEQWVTVRTKRFKDWFGDWQNDPENASKVVDANGEPMVLYHGTFIERESGDWDEFSLEGTRSSDVGFHFGTKNAAQDRIDSIIRNETNPDFAFMSRGRDVSTPRMMPVFLNIKNELRLDEHDRMPSWRGMEILDKIFDAIENGTANSDVSEAFGNDIEKYHEDELAIRYDEYGEGYLSERAKKYPHYANPERQNRWIGAYLGSKGFYGIVYKNTVEDKGNDSFIVFSPNQIKSATSNVGTFSEGSPSIMFQTPIDEAFDKSQALLDAMSKRGGIITNLVVRFADRSSSLKKKLIEANLKNARDLFVAQAGAGSRAKFFIDENFSPIYNGLNKENSEYLDKIIQLRRIIQIDEDFDSKGKPRIIHPSDKNGVPLNKERAEANLVDYESMFGSALYNDLINRSDLYFDAYKKLLSIMRDNGLITKELYDNLKSLLYQPRKFLDQFVSFEEGETTLDVKDLALNEAQIKTLQNGSDSEIMMNSRLLLAFSAKSVFSRVARNKTYTAISEAVKDPANDWISNKQLKNFKPVNYFVDGVREQFFIREDYQKQLYDSTRHLISPNVARVMRVLTGSAILKSFATQVNPLFALKNFPRDVLHVAMFTNIYGNNLYPALFRISRDAFRGMHDKMSNSKDFKEWLEYGGGMDFLSTEGFESRSVRVGAFNKIRDAMSTFGEYSEVGVRLAVYKKTKADLTDEFVKTNGRRPNKEESDTIKTQAAVASREIIDFAQGGSWAKAGENIIPYLNASIQGFRVGANYIVKNPKDFAVKFAQLSLAVGVIMFYNSMMADDDEWEKIQDGEKMRNFIIFTPFKDKDGNRYYIKIAKTQQAIAWITFAEMMSAKMLNATLNPDDDEKIADKYKIYGDRTYDALVDGLMTFFPKNPLDLKKEITSAIPAINALAAVNNYDTFINKQVSYDYQKVPAVYEDILDPDIPYFYKALSQSIHPVMEIGPKRLGTAVEKITTGAETSVIVAGAYYLLDNVARKVANLKTDELNLGEVPKGDSELNAISSMFSPLKGVVKKVNPNLKKYQYSEDLDDIALRGASSIKTIKNASRNLGEKYYDALRGQGDLTKDEVLKEVKDYRDMLIEKGVQKSQVESFVNAFKMSAKSSPRESWDAGYYDIMYSPSSDATVEIISKLKGDNLTDAELKEYFINYKKSTGYNIKNMGEVYSLYRKSRDKK